MSRRIYLDYAAATPMDPAVERAMRPYSGKVFGNPGSIHYFGQEASAAVFEARRGIARAIGADYREVIFTGSATEANNLALRGIVGELLNQELRIGNHGQQKTFLIDDSKFMVPRIIVSAIEHESILETARDLEKQGSVEVVYIPVSREGVVDTRKIKEALDERTVLVSIQYANSEIGVIQPIKKTADLIKEFRELRITHYGLKNDPQSAIRNYPIFHCDAVQAFQFLECDAAALGVDLMTISAHKIYGPKGIGVLYVRNKELGIRNKESILLIRSLVTGGGQEGGLRSGTENVPAIVGFAKAVELVSRARLSENRRIAGLQNYFWKELKKIFPRARLNGSAKQRLPNNLNFYLPGGSAHDRCIELDLLGVAVSPGVACSARSAEPSRVIAALGFSGDRPGSSLRFSFGRPTTGEELERVLTVMKNKFKMSSYE